MTATAVILNVMTWGAVIAVAIALVAAGMRRWSRVLAISRAVVVLGPVMVLARVVRFILLPFAGLGGLVPSPQAVVFSLGISEVVNGGALVLAASVTGAVLWGIARRRLRTGGP